ncbi:Ig-like domain-containing protein [Paenibacillus sp. KACC 21273]|uniref:Ig-like domain-containing protein n=1 Tax=Paenibacillus sp. KACC 21273 TaxID=3025665 RepID=UPI002365AADD|nr:Ig-like domain-containing protein [Paenibacillus sp. KACC 21273]WDF52328.1 Ig-like domain-containing protein [Paenibacillus sp. KACC 21273]
MDVHMFGDINTTDFKFVLSQLGKLITVNGIERKALITNTQLEQNYDDKRLTTLDSFQRGDIIVYNSHKYIVISEENDKRYNKYKGIIRKLPFTITFNKNCDYTYIDAYIETITFGIDVGEFLTLPSGSIHVHMKDDVHSQKIALNDRFIVNKKPFIVTGIDTYERVGICKITAKVDQISSSDDLFNNVANGLDCKVTITSPLNNALLVIGDTSFVQYKAPSSAKIIFSSDNSSVATINSSGLITALSAGTAKIKAQIINNEMFQDSITIHVKIPDKFTIEVSADKTSLEYNESSTIKSTVYNNGIPVKDADVTYQVVYANMTTEVSTDVAQLGNITNQMATLLNVNKGIPEDVYIKVTLNSNSTIYGYVPMHLNYYVPNNYGVMIYTGHDPAHELVYNDTMFLGKFVYNNGKQEDNRKVNWSLVANDKVTDIPLSIASIIEEDSFNQIYVKNTNITGSDVTFYIKAVLQEDNSVIDYYEVVAHSEMIKKSISISGNTTITSAKTDTWNVTVSPKQEDVTWSLFADDKTSTTNKATITSQTGTSVTLKAATVSSSIPQGYFQLKATLKSDSTIYTFYRIQLKSLF